MGGCISVLIFTLRNFALYRALVRCIPILFPVPLAERVLQSISGLGGTICFSNNVVRYASRFQ